MQTSTVTIAVLDPEQEQKFKLDPSELDIQTSRGSGPGGQHKNRTDSCVTITHKPTGVRVRVDMRSQHESKRIALGVLAARLAEEGQRVAQEERAAIRRNQLGSGQRGDKIRTYREVDDRVSDHRTDRTWSLKKWSRGDWE